MAIGDEHHYANGNSYIVTEMGPMITWHCQDCGNPAAASLEYTGTVRCSACWPKFHGIERTKKGTLHHERA